MNHTVHAIRQRMRRAAAFGLLAASTLLWSPALMALPTPAGTQIDNQAEVTFFDTDSGYHVRLRSNTVRVAVQALEALTLTPVNNVRAALGSFVTLAHRLTNTGNTPSSYTLAAANVAGDAFDLLDLKIVQDVNGNGQSDPGEPTLGGGAPLGPLAPGASLDVVIVGRLAATVQLGQTAQINLSATTSAQAVNAVVVDQVTVGEGAQLQVVKAVSATDAKPGQTVRFSLTASNNGNRAAIGVPLQVDGQAAVLALLRDTIPANTRFAGFGPNSSTPSSPALYHLAGQPAYSFVSTAPADLGLVDAIAFAFRDPIARGQTIARSFDVTLNANASVRITNTAQFVFNDGLNVSAVSTDSNPVQIGVPAVPPTIAYFADAAYRQTLRVMPVGRRLFVEADAAQCNSDPQLVETKRLTVRSALTGDVETYQAVETGANTGVFHIQPYVQSVDAGRTPAVHGDGLVSTRKDDRITTALEGCGAVQVAVSLLVDPYGVVYDSRSNLPVAGVVVTLIDVTGAGNGGNPGGPARVFNADVTSAPSTVTTGADGQFSFPLVPPSVYKLVVTAPSGYLFASLLPTALQPAGRIVNTPGSYGGEFPVDANTGAVEIDVPLDATARSDLFIDKTASRNTVELGEFVDYTVRVRNVADELLGRVRVTDRLPAGFAYVRGSARLNGGTTRLNGSALPEPDGGVGPVLNFEIGSMADQATATLTYRVRVSVGALLGDGINRVQASTPAPLGKVSNEATATVQVLPGVFSDRAFVVGKVFADCPRKPDEGQPYAEHDGLGVPGVRIYLQDGTHVITDRQGRYSLYGLAARTHVLKLDSTTLAGLKPKLTDHRQALDAGSRFADLKSGDLHRADFALVGCNDDIRKLIAERAITADVERSESDQLLTARFSTEPSTQADPRSLPATGTLSANGLQPNTARNVAPKTGNAAALPAAPTAAAMPDTLTDEQVASLIDNHLEIVNLKAGQTLAQPQATVIVKGRMGTRFKLTVNGVALGDRRVGKRSTMKDKSLQVWEFIGVDFLPGKNELELEQHDENGRVGERHMIVVTAPGALARLLLTPARPQPSADGKTPLAVVLEMLDANGVAIAARTPVTLDSNLGSNGAAGSVGGTVAAWQVRDLNPEEPGVQIFVEGGRAELTLMPPSEPGQALLRASSGSVQGDVAVTFVPDLRPLVAVGLIEGTLDLRRLNSKAFEPARAQDGFEQALHNLSKDFDGGRATLGARAALFLKGRIKGDMLLTAGYDSEKSNKERLFRDIQPDAYYAVYGDSSTRGFDAQSTGRLYVRVDHSRFYALIGDFNTQHINAAAANSEFVGLGERKLGQVARSLNGAKGQVRTEDGRSEVGGFASRSVSRQVVQELPALGISGPYMLTRLPFIENSEKVEIVTRDRDIASRTIKTVVMTRFADYEVEPLTGRLLFRAPVPSLDADFNPNIIRVSYEVDQGGDAFWVAGVQGSHQVSERLTVSGGVVADANPQDKSTLASAMAVAKLGERTAASLEVARMDKDSTAGNATRVEFKHDGATLQAQVTASRVERGFENPAAGVVSGQQEIVARAAVRLDPETVVKGELLASEDLTSGASRNGVQVGVERNLTPYLRGELAVRSSTTTAPTTTTTTTGSGVETGTSVRAKLLGQVPGMDNTSLFVEAEQDVRDSERRMFALGGEARLGSGVRLYGRHELISTLGQRFALNDQQQRNATVLGISGEPFADGQAFSEYRLRNAFSSREAEASMGLRQRWTLGQGLSLSGGIERVTVLAGASANESTAVTSSVDYNDGGDWRANGRLELRFSPRSDGLLSTVGAAWRIDAPWTLLARNALSVTNNSDGTRTAEDWLQVGAAYRDVQDNRLAALLRAEYRGQRNTGTQGADVTPADRDAFIVSAHASYQLRPGSTLSGRYATKWVNDRNAIFTSREHITLMSARVTQDFGDRWDVSLQSAVLANRSARQFGLGAEVGYLLSSNLWVSGGYNLFGLRDRELLGQDHTNPGAFLRLRFKFDENSF
jgi:large repetitive protein